MRIQSHFKDYYDNTVGYGIDPAIVYRRFTESYELSRSMFNRELDNEAQIIRDLRKLLPEITPVAGQLFDHVYVGFCGKIYVGLAFSVAGDNSIPVPSQAHWEGTSYIMTTGRQYAWSVRDVPDEELVKDRNNMYKRFDRCNTVAEWFERNQRNLVVDRVDFFAKYNIANFVLNSGVLHTEDHLASVRFQRKIDNFTAFQELSMFISGVLGMRNQVEPEPITDELRAQTKGFDKRSFRRDPTKNKKGA